jgi:uncharacterized Zn finger protein
MVVNCPNCGSTKAVVLSLHSDGFSRELIECRDCQNVWYSSLDTYKPCLGDVLMALPTHTKYSSCDDEYVAEDQKVWFS